MEQNIQNEISLSDSDSTDLSEQIQTEPTENHENAASSPETQTKQNPVVSFLLKIIFGPRDFLYWLLMLTETFGLKFILSLFVIQHLTKGFLFGAGTAGLVCFFPFF